MVHLDDLPEALNRELNHIETAIVSHSLSTVLLCVHLWIQQGDHENEILPRSYTHSMSLRIRLIGPFSNFPHKVDLKKLLHDSFKRICCHVKLI